MARVQIKKKNAPQVYFKDLEVGEAFRMKGFDDIHVKINPNDFKHTLSNRLGNVIRITDWCVLTHFEDQHPVIPVNADFVEN